MRRLLLGLAASALLLIGVGRGRAGIIYSQPLTASPGAQLGYTSDGPNNQAHDPQEIADNFTLSSNATLRQIQWYGSYISGPAPSGPVQFRFDIYRNLSGSPGSALFTETDLVSASNTGLMNLAHEPILSYSLNLGHAASLPGGQQLWLSILEDGSASIWTWQFSDMGDPLIATRSGDSGPWSFASTLFYGSMAFTLSDTQQGSATPEPATLTLLSISAVGILGYACRRRRKLTAG